MPITDSLVRSDIQLSDQSMTIKSTQIILVCGVDTFHQDCCLHRKASDNLSNLVAMTLDMINLEGIFHALSSR